MRTILLAMMMVFAMPSAHAEGGFADVLRSLSGSLRSGREAQPKNQQGVTPVMGVRGIDEANTTASAPASDDYLLIEGWMATRAGAALAAEHKGLAARQATLKNTSAPADAPR